MKVRTGNLKSLAAIACAMLAFLTGPTLFGAGIASASPLFSCTPVRIVVMQDQSGSTNVTRTPQLRDEDLNPIINLLRVCGGKLGFGLIRDRSNRNLLRLVIAPPPTEPLLDRLPRNPFLAAEVKAAFQRNLDAYLDRLQTWQGQTNDAVRTFEQRLRLLMRPRGDAPRTDIWSAVARANLFLSEPVVGPAPHVWAVFITDGRDNVHQHPVNFVSEATVVVVNGVGSVGVLKSLNPIQFEAPTAALSYLVDTEKAGGSSPRR